MHMKPMAKPAWDRLTTALEDIEPDCADDGRYIADRNENGDKKNMADICAGCPLLDLCIDYALIEQPRAGWWPGVQLKNMKRKEAA